MAVVFGLRMPRAVHAIARRTATRASRGLQTVTTAPHSLLSVRGGTQGGSVMVRTNMETDIATVDSSPAGQTNVSVHSGPCSASDVHVRDDSPSDLTIGIPGAFSVDVERGEGRGDVVVDGWLEGTVAVATASGDVSVKTVRGMLTTLATGEGDVSAELIDGDAQLSTGRGSISMEKFQGKVLGMHTGGGTITARAIYGEDVTLSAKDGDVHIKFLHADKAVVDVDSGAVRIDAIDGSARVNTTGSGASITVQLSDGVESLHLNAGGDIAVLMPDHLPVRGEGRGVAVQCDEGLASRPAPGEPQEGVIFLEPHGSDTATDVGSTRGATEAVNQAVHVVAISTAGRVHFKKHSWLDRFKLPST